MSLSSVKNVYFKNLRLDIFRHFLVRRFSEATSSDGDVQLPEEPTNCCMSGCANCVWIQYAEDIMTVFRDGNDRRAREIVLSKIEDANMRAYLELELKCLENRSKESGGSK